MRKAIGALAIVLCLLYLAAATTLVVQAIFKEHRQQPKEPFCSVSPEMAEILRDQARVSERDYYKCVFELQALKRNRK